MAMGTAATPPARRLGTSLRQLWTTPTGFVIEKLISGVAPHANVIMYDVCNAGGCGSAGSVAAVNQAVLDGVDVINFSISGGNNPYADSVELAFLGASSAGIFVSTSAGNNGPGPNTVAHRSPWLATVAASTHNRLFSSSLIDMSGGNTHRPPISLGKASPQAMGQHRLFMRVTMAIPCARLPSQLEPGRMAKLLSVTGALPAGWHKGAKCARWWRGGVCTGE